MTRAISNITLSVAFLLLGLSAFSQLNTTYPRFNKQNSQVTFIENRGQLHDEFNEPRPDVLCMGVSQSSQLLLTASGFSHQLQRIHYREMESENSAAEDDFQQFDSITFNRVDLHWLNSESEVSFEKLDRLNQKYHYYNLPNQSEGITGVSAFESIRLKGIYPGIDVRFYDAGGLFEHDYEISPGADYRDIQIEISGAEAQLNESGELVFETPLGTIIESSPVVFQEGKKLASRWIRIEDNIWGFEIQGAGNATAMVIDPITRVWGTYYGGGDLDEIAFAKVDLEVNIYAVGGSESSTNIATSGTEQTTIAFGLDAFLARFDSDGNQIWGTYLGGNGNEVSRGLDFDESGNIVITGYTESTNNIATPGSHQEVQGDSGVTYDGFVAKFNSDGIRLWGTYYGGLYDDRPRFIHIGDDEQVYVTGVTTSENNIATPGSHQEVYLDGTNDVGNDCFLVKFTPDGVRLWATYYGGLSADQAFTVTTDSDLNIYMIGHTESFMSIATPGAYQTDHGGGQWDTFYVKFNADGVRQWATYLGGNGNDLVWNCSIHNDSEIFLTGRTSSNNLSLTAGTHQDFLAGNYDVFLMKVTTDGDKVWETYFGGSQFERAYGCESFADGSVLIAGRTESDNLISTPGVHQENYGGGIDAFLSKFNNDGTLDWSTYYGGGSDDMAFGCAMDSEEAVYLAGWAESDTDISTPDIHQEIYAGNRDGIIAKFAECEEITSSISATACESYTAPDGEIYTQSGQYTAVIPNPTGCDSIISISLTINQEFEETNSIALCQGDTHTLPDGSEVNDAGIYTSPFVSSNGCDSTYVTTIDVFPNYNFDFSMEVCENDTLIDPEGNPVLQPGDYTYELSSINGCDSLIQWSVEEHPTYFNSTSVEICGGEEHLTPGGQILTETGTVEEVFSTTAGCDSTFITELTVFPSYTFNIDTAICDNQTYTLPDGSVVEEPGEYSFEFITQSGCDSTYSISLEVTPDIEISDSYELCAGETLELPDGTIVQPDNDTEYQVTITGETGCDSLFNIGVVVFDSFVVNTEVNICEGEEFFLPDGVSVDIAGDYVTVLQSITGCDSIINTTLEISPAPDVTFDVPDAFCFEEGFVTLNPTPAGGTLSGDFVEGNGLNLEGASEGEYSVLYEYSDENGCTTQAEEIYALLPHTQPVFAYSADCLYRVDFFNQTNGETLDFQWMVDSTVFSDEASPTHAFNEAGEFTVELVATNIAGCTYSYSQIITLSDGLSLDDFWVPNIITPNGDGKNDVLKTMPEDQNCLDYEIMIYNRWGMKVYESSNSGTPFDGRDIDGQELPDGTYFYILESSQFNCSEAAAKDICTGTITILR